MKFINSKQERSANVFMIILFYEEVRRQSIAEPDMERPNIHHLINLNTCLGNPRSSQPLILVGTEEKAVVKGLSFLSAIRKSSLSETLLDAKYKLLIQL